MYHGGRMEPMDRVAPLLIVLDLDETLVHSRRKPLEDRRPDFWWAGYAVYVRPGARSFLQQLAGWANVAIWTASDADYAFPVLSRVLQEGPEQLADRFAFVWTSERCLPEEDGEVPLVKPLSEVFALGHDPARTVVVDNRPATFARNRDHGIAVMDYLGAPEDQELPQLQAFLEQLRDAPDVRAVPKRPWRSPP